MITLTHGGVLIQLIVGVWKIVSGLTEKPDLKYHLV